MEALIYLDTHVVVWLYLPRLESLSPSARRQIDDSDLLISPMVTLELEYLHEIGRLNVEPHKVVQSLGAQLGLKTCDLEFPKIIDQALTENWTRDPFDRIITAQARAADRKLVTRDETILANYPLASW